MRVWAAAPDDIPDDELAIARDWLDAGERAQAARFVRPGLTRAYEVAHAVLRLVVGSAADRHPGALLWWRDPCPGCGEPHGRPRAVGVEMEFSLSHTDGMVVVATADRPVGVDVEVVRDPTDDLVDALHPREIAEIRAAPAAERALRFTRAWTRTEAYLKGLGIGLARPPSLDHLGTDPEPVRHIGEWEVHDVAVSDGFVGAVAQRRPGRE